MTVCARGCTTAQHLPDCPDTDTCPGCLPRQAEYGLLCYGCHTRLLDMLRTAPGQVHLLETEKAGSMARPIKHDADLVAGADDGPPAPLSIPVIDTIQRVGDILSEWVEMLCEDYRLAGPETFTVKSGSTWLLAQIQRLEACEGIGDLWEELGEVMSQAHALAPWREEVRRLKGIPCPECQRCALVVYGGDEDVTCQRCRAVIPKERYAIWVRIAAEEWGRETA